MENVGAKYPVTFVDKNGDFLQGSNSYKLNLPKDIPVALFWSVTVYDPVTGSGLDNGSGVWCLELRGWSRNPGERLKNDASNRATPLADAIIAEGYLDYVATLDPEGALFPDDRPGQGSPSRIVGGQTRRKSSMAYSTSPGLAVSRPDSVSAR